MTSPSHPDMADRSDALAATVASFATTHRVPAVAAGIVTDQHLAWQVAHGWADLAGRIPATTDTVFRVGSVTKSFTSAAVLLLRDRGRVRLDDALVQHLPEFARATNPFGAITDVTLRRLLTHEAGLPVESPAFDWAERRFPSPQELVATLDQVILAVAPETEVKYSNLGYELLGEVIGRVSGMDFRTFVSERFLEPLGMRASGFDPMMFGSNMAQGHDPPTFSDIVAPSPDRMKATDADGGLCSTVEDLAAWLSLHFRTDASLSAGGTQVLAGATLAEMQRPRRVLNADWSQAMGMGWRAYRVGGRTTIGHAGGTFGFTAKMLFLPTEKVGGIVLTNGEAPAGDLVERLLDLWLAPPSAPPSKASAPTGATATSVPVPTPEAFVALLGLYAWEDHSAPARVEWVGGALTLTWFDGRRGRDECELAPTGDPLVFTVRGSRATGETCTFRRGDTGNIVGLTIAGWPMVRLATAR